MKKKIVNKAELNIKPIYSIDFYFNLIPNLQILYLNLYKNQIMVNNRNKNQKGDLYE